MIRDSLDQAALVDSTRAQTALVDAIVFMILMSLASGIILGSGGGTAYGQSEMESLQQYSHDFTDTLLAVEIESPNYIDPEDNQITMNGSACSIGQLLCDAAIINYQSTGQVNFSGYVTAILNTGNSVIRPGLGYAVYSHVGSNQAIFLSNQIDDVEELPDELYASQRLYDVHGNLVNITIFVWVIT